MERLTKIGEVEGKSSSQIKYSRFGIGFEKLDRELHDPEMAYDKMAETGVKWVRIQSGWQRTEKEKGVYDFSWLDSVVDNLIERGMWPWIDLCYGNKLYSEKAAEAFGAVGVPPIENEEGKQAWVNYCTALAKHFKGRVSYFEIWNEPEGCWKFEPSGKVYGQFAIATAKAVKAGNPDAKLLGGALSKIVTGYFAEALDEGLGDYIYAVTYHEYTPDERSVPYRVRSLRGLLNLYNPEIKIIQGEAGSQSRSDGHGAMYRGAWTEAKQAKQLLRRTIVDLSTEVEFLSYFSCVDMIEGLDGFTKDVSSYRDYGYFGILGAEFGEDGLATGEYRRKMSHRAYQTVCALFSEDVYVTELPIIMIPRQSHRVWGWDDDNFDTTSVGFKDGEGRWAYVYWKPTNIMANDYQGTTTIHFSALKGTPHLVDLMDGSIYEIPEKMIEKNPLGGYDIVHLPIKDYPMALTTFC